MLTLAPITLSAINRENLASPAEGLLKPFININITVKFFYINHMRQGFWNN